MQTNPNDFLSETELDDEDDEKIEIQLAQAAADKKLAEDGAEVDSQESIEEGSQSDSEGEVEEPQPENNLGEESKDQDMADSDDEVVKQAGKNSKRRKLLDK